VIQYTNLDNLDQQSDASIELDDYYDINGIPSDINLPIHEKEEIKMAPLSILN